MLKVLAVMLLLAVAQILPSCGDKGSSGTSSGEQASNAPVVIGWVDEKRTHISETIPYFVVINSVEYAVSYEFWKDVRVGDLVKNDGQKWTIVRKAAR